MAWKRSANSTQPKGPVITAHKRPDNDTHQSQWKIISPPYHNNTPTTKNKLITIITQSPGKDKSWSHSCKCSTIQQTAPEHGQSSDSCPLKMPATETGEMLGRKTLRRRPNSPENPQQPSDPGHESLREYISLIVYTVNFRDASKYSTNGNCRNKET